MKPFYTSPADRAVLLLIKEGKPVPPPQALRITKLERRGLVQKKADGGSAPSADDPKLSHATPERGTCWDLTPAGEEQIA